MSLTKECLVCGKTFSKSPSISLQTWMSRTKFCSHSCYSKARIGGEGLYKPFWKGKKLPEEVCEKISLTNKRKGIEPKIKSIRYGADNNRWKPEEQRGYTQKHITLTKKYGRPLECEFCGKIGCKLNGRWTVEWAKKEGHAYTCKREDYLWLCHKCHMQYDHGVK